MANTFRKIRLLFIRPLRETCNPALEGLNYIVSCIAASTSSLQRKEGMQPPEKPFHAKPHLLQAADKSFMHKELPI